MTNKFQIGEIVYITHGVREINIQAVQIIKIRGKTAYVSGCGGEEFKIHICCLIRDRDLIQEIFDYIKNTQNYDK